MNYSLMIPGLTEAPTIEITADEFRDLKQSQNILLNALAIEEKYEILISNYMEFEKQILNMTADYMVRDHIDYSGFFDLRLNLNIRLVNFLTAAKLYVDQLNTNIRECLPNESTIKEIVKVLFSKEYDENVDYRFMEALRNHVQHYGLPVHWTQQGTRWTSLGKDGLLEFSIDFASNRSDLSKNKKFKKTVLKELPETIDLKLATRGYVESLSNVHEAIRDMIKKSVQMSRNLIEKNHQKYKSIYSESLIGLCACKFETGNLVKGVHLFYGMDEVRIKLQNRNKKLANLKNRYVTNSVKAHNNSLTQTGNN